MTSPESDAADASGERWVPVWDPLVRVFHWLVAAAFFVAYFTEGDVLTLHVWAGYTVGGLVVLRVLWGLVGPKHARFSDFVFAPAKVWADLIGIATLRAKRYIGHSPTGGAMVVALLIGLAATVWSGLALYAVEEGAGPLAGLYAGASYERSPGPSGTRAERRESDPDEAGDEDRDEDEDEREDDKSAEDFWEELHEVLANLMLVLVAVHIAGVALASFAHRENLVRAMVTGRKKAESD